MLVILQLQLNTKKRRSSPAIQSSYMYKIDRFQDLLKNFPIYPPMPPGASSGILVWMQTYLQQIHCQSFQRTVQSGRLTVTPLPHSLSVLKHLTRILRPSLSPPPLSALEGRLCLRPQTSLMLSLRECRNVFPSELTSKIAPVHVKSSSLNDVC